MTTNNSVNVGLSGSTGSGTFVGATSPTLVTPTIGAATATSITFNPTTSGIIGTTTNDNAAAGKVGEFVSSQVLFGSAVTFTSGVTKDLTSISLTAGDWDVWGNLFSQGTSVSVYQDWINSASVTAPDASLISYLQVPITTTSAICLTCVTRRFSLSGTTTIYISGNITGTGTITCSGGIYARRVR